MYMPLLCYLFIVLNFSMQFRVVFVIGIALALCYLLYLIEQNLHEQDIAQLTQLNARHASTQAAKYDAVTKLPHSDDDDDDEDEDDKQVLTSNKATKQARVSRKPVINKTRLRASTPTPPTDPSTPESKYDSASITFCYDAVNKYNIDIGKSWGSASGQTHIQQEWERRRCDVIILQLAVAYHKHIALTSSTQTLSPEQEYCMSMIDRLTASNPAWTNIVAIQNEWNAKYCGNKLDVRTRRH